MQNDSCNKVFEFLGAFGDVYSGNYQLRFDSMANRVHGLRSVPFVRNYSAHALLQAEDYRRRSDASILITFNKNNRSKLWPVGQV